MKQVILKRMKVFGGNEHHLENGFVHEIFKQVPSTMRSNEALPGQVLPLGPANCKPGGRTLDTQTASADLSLTSAALSCCIVYTSTPYAECLQPSLAWSSEYSQPALHNCPTAALPVSHRCRISGALGRLLLLTRITS